MSRSFQVEKLEDRVAPSVCNLLGGLLSCADGSGDGGSGGSDGGGSGDGGSLPTPSLPSLSLIDLCGDGNNGGVLGLDLIDGVLPEDGLPQVPHIPTTGDLPFDKPGGDITDLDATVLKNIEIGDAVDHEGPLGANGTGQLYGFASLETIQADGHADTYLDDNELLEVEPACVIVNTGLETDAGSPAGW